MADVLIKVDENVIPEIARAIMNKTGKSDPLKLPQFASEIDSIEVGGGSGGSGDNISHLYLVKPLQLTARYETDVLTIEKVV